MTVIDEFRASGRYKKSNITKGDLQTFVNASLEQILEINEVYKKVFEGSEASPALLNKIEQKFTAIKQKYEDFFQATGEQSQSKVVEIEQKIKEIRDYHSELISQEDSIKSDIEESQKHITDFYNFLFSDSDGGKSKEDSVKKAVEEILAFNTKLNDGEDAYKKVIENAHDAILSKYNDLFEADENGISKIKTLDSNIDKINKFEKEIVDKIAPELKTRRGQIGTMMEEVSSLLSNATARTLAQGYLESMHEYSKKKKIYNKNQKGEVVNSKMNVLLHNTGRHIPQIINYFLFIVPLVIASGVYIYLVKDLGNNPNVGLSITKFLATVPILWLSWFGQRNLSERKRLFEEYNHKLRVVQMYLMFSNQDEESPTYRLENKAELESILLKVIERNPSETFGRDETMLDKLFQIIEAKRTRVEKKLDSVVDLIKPNTDK